MKTDPGTDEIRYAIQDNDLETLNKLLRELGINAVDPERRTALINAAIANKPEFVTWLLSQGADPNIQDHIGYTALHFTGQHRLSHLAATLLANGANPNRCDAHGNPPLWTAVFNARLPEEDKGVIVELLKAGADPDIKNKYGRSARDIFESYHDKDIQSLLTA